MCNCGRTMPPHKGKCTWHSLKSVTNVSSRARAHSWNTPVLCRSCAILATSETAQPHVVAGQFLRSSRSAPSTPSTACSAISAADNEAEAKRESMEGARDRPSFMSPVRLRRRLLNYCSHPRLAAARISTDHSLPVPVDRGACRSCCGRTISSS